jgi:hypothetical protein
LRIGKNTSSFGLVILFTILIQCIGKPSRPNDAEQRNLEEEEEEEQQQQQQQQKNGEK